MLSKIRWQRGLLLGMGVMAVACLAFAASGALDAQTKGDGKKTEKKAPPAKDDDKGDDKKPDVKLPKVTPRIIDVMEGSRGGVEQVALINELVEKGWNDNKIAPADRCTDYEFIRRASLDIIGRIPTVEEISRFLKVPETRRRSQLIEWMLEGKEYGSGAEFAEHFANHWTVMLLTRTGSAKVYQEQMKDWLIDHFQGSKSDAPDWAKTATALITATGDTNKNGAVNFVLHHLGEAITQDRAKNGAWDMVPVTSRTTKLFLGIRTQCVQCHDHPFNGEWNQQHFWAINAFYRQVDPNGRPDMMAKKKKKGMAGVQQYELKENTLFNEKGLVPYERRNGVLLFTDSMTLDGKGLPKNFSGSRREYLAKNIVASPYFAKAFVNRMWGHFFGKSFTKDALDDFGDHNPVSHPDLLERLGDDWAKKYKHNPKDIVRWIANSRAYGLSGKSSKYNDKSDDEAFFPRMLQKPMTPEQLFESLMTATQAKIGQDKAKKREAREDWLSKLNVNFGNDEGEEGNYSGTVVQSLLLMNGQKINEDIMDENEGTVAAVLKKRANTPTAARDAVRDLFLATVSRPPTEKELDKFLNPKMFSFRPGSATTPTTQAFWTGYYQDVMWALVNSNEFFLNH